MLYCKQKAREGIFMNWSAGKSVRLSQACVIVFAALLLALDVFAYPLVTRLCASAHYIGGHSYEQLWTVTHWQFAAVLLAAVYAGSVFAWIVLWKLFALLRRIHRGDVFDEQNVKLLRTISWCCFGAAAASLAGGAVYLPLLVLAGAAGFMGLIVRIVKNVFQQAILMKSELDFTV